MSNPFVKKYLPIIIGLIIFLAITIVYLSPLLEGKRLKQLDVNNHKGMAKELMDYREQTGEEALWTNSMFGGMPGFQISVVYHGNIVKYIDQVFKLGLPHPAGLVFLYFIGFFFLLLVLRVDPWLAIGGAIAYAFSSYFFIILEVGHNSKAHAIGYMAPVLASIIMTFRGKMWLGGALTALFLSLELSANHLQITYYLFIIVIALGISELIVQIREKAFVRFAKAFGVLIIAAILAVGPNITNIMTTYEYGKYTTRGKSELTFDKDNKTTGLDRDYATAWSYGIPESFSLFIPNIKGGASGYIGDNKKVLKDVDPQFKQAVAQNNHYWGEQPGTSGPVYTGAVVMFFFILALFFVRGRNKYYLLAAGLLGMMLAWGRHFQGLTDFFLDYVPGYNKFRAVSMTMVIVEVVIPLLAFLGIMEIFKDPSLLKKKKASFYVALGLTSGLALIFYIAPGLFSFFSENEINQFAQIKTESPQQAAQYDELFANIEVARQSIFKSDVLRSLLFSLFAAALVFLYSRNKIKKPVFIVVLGLLILLDMVPVATRYLDKDDFERKAKVINPFKKSVADNFILQDPGLSQRVLNLSVSTFNDASTSYFHKSIGGYHGAKLKRYQELIEHKLSAEIQDFTNSLNQSPTDSTLRAVQRRMPVVNMLNTKYIILSPQSQPAINLNALGNAWFVDSVRIVENSDSEILGLRNFDPSSVAIVDKRFDDMLSYELNNDSSNVKQIALTNYLPNHLIYKSNIDKGDGIAVFSEIYYVPGWKAYIDGAEVPHFRTNYVLRGMVVPAGEHTIEFKFEPEFFYRGERIALISSLVLIAGLIAAAFVTFRRKDHGEEEAA